MRSSHGDAATTQQRRGNDAATTRLLPRRLFRKILTGLCVVEYVARSKLTTELNAGYTRYAYRWREGTMNAHQLCRASIENLERLARFMGIPIPPPSSDYKYRLIAAILRAELEEREMRRVSLA